MNCAYKFRIYPNKEQEKQIAQSLGCARFIFNRILELLETGFVQNAEQPITETSTLQLTF